MHQSHGPEFESFISFTCPTCGSLNQDVIGVPAMMAVSQAAEPRIGEQEQSHACGRCVRLFRLNVRNLGNRVVVKLVDFPSLEVKASQAYWSEESEALGIDIGESLKDPYGHFADTVADVREVIRTPHAEFFDRTLSRMALIQLFAAMEAFLTDTLLARVLDDRARLTRLLAGVKDLQSLKLTLADVLADPDIVRHTVADAMQKLSFHNFSKVDAIWNVAFGHGIFKNDATRQRLLRYVPIRHDCVHRNGRTEDGSQRVEVDFALVREVADQFEGTALFVEGQFEGEDFDTGVLDG